MWADAINAVFEAFMAGSAWLSVREIVKHKQVRGTSSVPMWVATAWGFYNLFYYPHLHQWISWGTGAGVVVGNSVWCILAWRFRKS